MSCSETEADTLLSRGGASVRLSSIQSGCAYEKGVYGLPERKDGTGAVLPWSCGTVGAKVAKAESS